MSAFHVGLRPFLQRSLACLKWHWAAVREVIKRHPEMTHREAVAFAQSIIRYVSIYYGKWSWG